MREPYQSGPPKAEGNQKAGSGQTDEGTSQGPLSYTEKPPGGARGPLRAEQGRNRPGCPLTPGRPPRVGEAPRPPPPSSSGGVAGVQAPAATAPSPGASRPRAPGTVDLAPLCPNPTPRVPRGLCPQLPQNPGSGGVLPFCHDWGGGRGGGGSPNPTRPHHAQPAPWGGDAFFGHAEKSESGVGVGGWQHVWL